MWYLPDFDIPQYSGTRKYLNCWPALRPDVTSYTKLLKIFEINYRRSYLLGSIGDQCYLGITSQLTFGLLIILHLKITRAHNVQGLGVARQWGGGGGKANLLC